MSVKRSEIVCYLDKLLRTREIKDCSQNGLQVEGVARVRRIGMAVDASLEVYAKAVRARCEMVLVHHGLIWGGLSSVSGPAQRHVKYLLDHGLNLYASHLPLDMHPEFGNNIQLARMLGLEAIEPFGLYHDVVISYQGVLSEPMTVDQVARAFKRRIGGRPMVLAMGRKAIRTVGICSGGGGDLLGEAIAKGLDCYVTGEPLHYNYIQAKEGKINVVYLGHYHSEQAGVCAIASHLAERFKVRAVFLDCPTPI